MGSGIALRLHRSLSAYSCAREARNAAEAAAGLAPPEMEDGWRWSREMDGVDVDAFGEGAASAAQILETRMLVRINGKPFFCPSLVKLVSAPAATPGAHAAHTAHAAHADSWSNLEYTSPSGNLVVPCSTIGAVRIYDSTSLLSTRRCVVLELYLLCFA